MSSGTFFFKSAVAAGLATMAIAAVASPRYKITEVVGPSGQQVNVGGMNDSGQLTGWVSSNTGPSQAFMTDANGTDLKLLGPTDHGYSIGLGINNLGQVVGETADFKVAKSLRGFVATSTNLQPIPMPDGYQSSISGINDGGRLVGYQLLPGDGYYYDAVVGDMRHGVRPIHGPYGDHLSLRDINAGGGIAGSDAKSYDYSAHVVTGTAADLVDLGTLGGTRASAQAINDYNVLTGYSELEDGSIHALTGTLTGGLVDLGLPAGASASYGQDINNHGVVTGSFRAGSDDRAFVHTDADGFIDLNLALDKAGPGWLLMSGKAINNAGQIAGQGIFQGRAAAFLLTPVPEPETVALALAGLAVIIGMPSLRRRQSPRLKSAPLPHPP